MARDLIEGSSKKTAQDDNTTASAATSQNIQPE
jgi:hypothetical protein